jgi:cellulose synthase/poly-beta-1,6-N-acetylglucosamine synthase-like glycosyltransferase
VQGLDRDLIEDFTTYQFLVAARRAQRDPASPHDPCGLTSIVIVTHNQVAYTRQCLDSIRDRTDEPFEIIVVDNGSTDGTREYLENCDDLRAIFNVVVSAECLPL